MSSLDHVFFTPEESNDWLKARMLKKSISSLEELAQMTGIDRGAISRYFRHERRPAIDVIEPFCKSLEVSPNTLLKVLGAIPK